MLAAIVIIAVIALLLLIPIVIEADYDANGLKASARAAFAHFEIYPKGRKALKLRQKKKRIKEKLPSLSFEEWFYVVKITVKALLRLKKRICIDRLRFIYVSADADPSNVAMRYAAVNAAASAILTLFEQGLRIKSSEVNISANYEADESLSEFGVSLSLSLGYMLYILFAALLAVKSVSVKSAFKSYRERKLRRGQQAGRFNA